MNTNQVSKVFRNLTMKMCHVSFEMIIINKHIHKLLASRNENLFGMKIFTRINNLKFLKNGTKRQIVMRSWKRERERNAIEVYIKWGVKNINDTIIIRKNVLFSKLVTVIQMKYYDYFHGPVTALGLCIAMCASFF